MLCSSSSSHISVIRKEIISVQCNAVPKCKHMLQSNAVLTVKFNLDLDFLSTNHS